MELYKSVRSLCLLHSAYRLAPLPSGYVPVLKLLQAQAKKVSSFAINDPGIDEEIRKTPAIKILHLTEEDQRCNR